MITVTINIIAMKQIFSFAAAALFISVLTVSCGAAKKAVPAVEGEQEVSLVFNEPKYRSDKDYFRDSQSGISKDLSAAKKVAMQNTRQSIGAMVEAQVGLVVDNYTSNEQTGSDSSVGNDLEEMGRTVVNSQLSGLEIVAEKAFKLPDGSYRYHVCMQLSKDALGDALEEAIEKDAKLKLKVKKNSFRAIYEEVIRK